MTLTINSTRSIQLGVIGHHLGVGICATVHRRAPNKGGCRKDGGENDHGEVHVGKEIKANSLKMLDEDRRWSGGKIERIRRAQLPENEGKNTGTKKENRKWLAMTVGLSLYTPPHTQNLSLNGVTDPGTHCPKPGAIQEVGVAEMPLDQMPS